MRLASKVLSIALVLLITSHAWALDRICQGGCVDSSVRVWDVVEDFGADPTGVTDSTSRIQEAISFAGSSLYTGKKKVTLPCGQYKIGGTGSIWKGVKIFNDYVDGVSIEGENYECVRLFPSDTVTNGLYMVTTCNMNEADFVTTCDAASTDTTVYPRGWSISGINYDDDDPLSHRGTGEEPHGQNLYGEDWDIRDMKCSHIGDECLQSAHGKNHNYENIHIASAGISDPADAIEITDLAKSGTEATATTAEVHRMTVGKKVQITGVDFDDWTEGTVVITIDGREVQLDSDGTHGLTAGDTYMTMAGLTEATMNGTFLIDNADANAALGQLTYYLPESACHIIGVTAASWAHPTTYAVGDVVIPVTGGSGFYFTVTTGGDTVATEPTWETTFRAESCESGSVVVYEAIPETTCPTTCAGACLASIDVSFDYYNSFIDFSVASVPTTTSFTYEMVGTPEAAGGGASMAANWVNGGAGIAIQSMEGVTIDLVYLEDESDYGSSKASAGIIIENFTGTTEEISGVKIGRVFETGFSGQAVISSTVNGGKVTTGLSIDELHSEMAEDYQAAIEFSSGGKHVQSRVTGIHSKAPLSLLSKNYESEFKGLYVDTSLKIGIDISLDGGGNTLDSIVVRNATRQGMQVRGDDPSIKLNHYSVFNVGSDGNYALGNALGSAALYTLSTFTGFITAVDFWWDMNISGDYGFQGADATIKSGTIINAGRGAASGIDIVDDVTITTRAGGSAGGITSPKVAVRNSHLIPVAGNAITVTSDDVIIENTKLDSGNIRITSGSDILVRWNDLRESVSGTAIQIDAAVGHVDVIGNITGTTIKIVGGSDRTLKDNTIGTRLLVQQGDTMLFEGNNVGTNIEIEQTGAGTTDDITIVGGHVSGDVTNEAGSTTTEMTNLGIYNVTVEGDITVAGAGVADCEGNIMAGGGTETCP